MENGDMQALQITAAAYYLHAIEYCTNCLAIVDKGTVKLPAGVLQRHAAKATDAYYKKFGCQ